MTLPRPCLLLMLLCAVAPVGAEPPPPVSAQPSVEELTRTPAPAEATAPEQQTEQQTEQQPEQQTEQQPEQPLERVTEPAPEPGPTPAPVTEPTPEASPASATAPKVTVDFRITGLVEPELTNAYNWLGFVAEDQRGRLDYPRLKTLHDGAEVSIQKALQPYGYYAPRITRTLTGGPRDYFARYAVEPGTPVRWAATQLEVTGAGADQREVLAAFAPRVGRRLRHAEYDTYKSRALNALREAGYLNARLTKAELQVDTQQHLAVAALTFDTGPHWTFGTIRFEGSTAIDEAVLRRYLRFAPGDSYSPQKMLDTQFALNDLDYFATVQIDPQRAEAQDNVLPVTIKLTDSKARRDDYGVGYGTDTGARLTAATEFRRWNAQGHKLRLAVRASQKISGASAEYRIPRGDEPGEFLSFTGAAEQDNVAFGRSRDFRLGAATNRDSGGWQRITYLRYHRSQFDFDEGLDNSVSLLTPGISFSRQWLDDPAYARRGFSLFFDTHGAQRGVLSDASFVQVRTLVKGALPLAQRTRFLGRAELGASLVRGFDNLPPDERFFAGGDQSVRGYAYQSIGAGRDDNGGVIGGRYLNVFSAELEQGFRQTPWGVAAFVDAGGIGNVPNPRLEYGVGLGARYRAPFGSVQVDLAHPLKAGESPVRLHLGVRVGL